jgi:hypothetical protein
VAQPTPNLESINLSKQILGSYKKNFQMMCNKCSKCDKQVETSDVAEVTGFVPVRVKTRWH